MKRITVTVSDWQDEALRELSELDEISVSHAVRQALSAMLPTQLELARFLRNPTTSPGEAADLADSMETLLSRFAAGGRVVAAGDEAGARKPRKRPALPPSGNTGANQP